MPHPGIGYATARNLVRARPVGCLSSAVFSISPAECDLHRLGDRHHRANNHEPENCHSREPIPVRLWAEVFRFAFGSNAGRRRVVVFADTGVLVLSTSLCIPANTPSIIADLRPTRKTFAEQTCVRFPTRPRPRWNKVIHRAHGVLANAGNWAGAGRSLQQRGHRRGPWHSRLDGGCQRRARPTRLGLHSRPQCHRAGVPGGLARWRLDRARADVVRWAKRPGAGGGMIADVPCHRLSGWQPEKAFHWQSGGGWNAVEHQPS